jgi:hypothetical protein|tara:strand:+ start:66 stop:731 length:666 start_codon:yes stop_codon:yes gene_type:complete
MATSGTTTFDLSIDKLVERAYARCGTNLRTGYELSAARDNLNLLFSEWGNRGIHLWKVKNHTQNLTAGTTTYTAPSDASDVLELVFRNGSTDTSMTKISRSEYENLPNKTSQGTPSQYYVRRNLSNVTITLYQTPNTTDTQINYYYVGRIEDAGNYTNTADAPYRFLPCLVSGLAYYTSQEVAPERSQELERRYEAELQRALTEDSQSTSVHIVPRDFYVG